MALIGLGNVKRALNNIPVQANRDIKDIYIVGLKEIIKETPVDNGRAINNWFLSVGAPSNKTTTSTGGGSSFAQVGKLPASVIGRKIYFTNNLPYINMLEYGGYSQPGTDKTSGGYSIKAAKGWVRKAIGRMANKVRKI